MTIYDAAHSRNPELFYKCLDEYCQFENINKPDHNGQLPLHHAIIVNNNDEIIEYLLVFTDDLNHVDNEGYTPLLLAASVGNIENCNTLLNIYNVKRSVKTRDGRTYIELLRMASNNFIHKEDYRENIQLQ